MFPEVMVLGTTASGVHGVEQALALQPHVVFIDIQMPGLTGLEAAELICEQWMTQQFCRYLYLSPRMLNIY